MLKGVKYYILGAEGELIEVDEDSYKDWYAVWGHEYILPDYLIADNHDFFCLETMFHGISHENEELRPFLLFYFEGKLVVTDDGVEKEHIKDEVFNFKTFDEIEFARNKIITALENKNSST